MTSKRIQVRTATGDSLSILVEYQPGGYTFPYTAVLGDWDLDCSHANGKTPREAVEALLEDMGVDAHPDETSYIDCFFPEALPMLLRRQAC